jgi:hypothetical protein
MANFLKPNPAAASLRGAWHTGVGDMTVNVIKKIHDAGPRKLDDQLLKGVYVAESPHAASVRAIKKCLEHPMRETGDTMTKLRQVNEVDLSRLLAGRDNLRKALPPQSSNGTWQDAPASRVGASSGPADVDQQFGRQSAPVSGQRSASVESSRSAGPQDDDADKRKPRGESRARRALRRDNVDQPLDHDPDDSCLDACGKAIRELHRQGPRPLFERR